MPIKRNKKVRSKDPIVGIIGGMGPRATLELQRLILESTPAARDQDHVQVLVHNNPNIPDRTESLQRDGGRSFVQAIVATGRGLIDAGATVLCMPCNTAHARFDEIQTELSQPLLHMVQLTVDEIVRRRMPQPIALFATDGTIKERVFARALDARGVSFVVPHAINQHTLMDIIYAIKAGEDQECIQQLKSLMRDMTGRGARSVLLGCTELGMYEKELGELAIPLINPLRILGEHVARGSF